MPIYVCWPLLYFGRKQSFTFTNLFLFCETDRICLKWHWCSQAFYYIFVNVLPETWECSPCCLLVYSAENHHLWGLPIGKLANEAAQLALHWFRYLTLGLEKEERGCGMERMIPGVSDSHSKTHECSSRGLLERHLGKNGAWQNGNNTYNCIHAQSLNISAANLH